jgi:hypothetical protein
VFHARLLYYYLIVRNYYCVSSIRSDAGSTIVSMTTYGQRLNAVYLTIESIARGSSLPKRLILWLNVEVVLPKSLMRLQRRGLEICYCENFGPHTKYYPYLEENNDFELPLATADDDMLYSKNWLQELIAANMQYPDVINCFRKREIIVSESGLESYVNWLLGRSTKASFSKMATGVSGVIYPVGFQYDLKRAGREFIAVCPKADDIWLHAIALRNDYRVRQIYEKAMDFLYMPNSQDQALWQTNGPGGGNDKQLAATYTAQDIAKMRRNVE